MAKNKKVEVQNSVITKPPVVAVLGHVDHGKTTLLDTIRKTNIANREHGGITQHIGAYQIDVPKTLLKQPNYPNKITFIDTPGHQAFAEMRSRGATVADIAILVVAANDGVKPQTIESIEHIKKAKIPFIVALNKIDLPNINQEIVKKQLSKKGVNLEEYGGETPMVGVSAKDGTGIDKLLEMILLLNELFMVKQTENNFEAVVIESLLSKNKGITATIIVRSGSISVADDVVYENQVFRIRALINWQGHPLTSVTGGDPAEVLGWKVLPKIGSKVYLKSETEIMTSPAKALTLPKSRNIIPPEGVNALEEQHIRIILRADTAGTLEAITSAVGNKVETISSAVGNISESDVLLAKTTKALIIGFSLKPDTRVLKLAQSEKVLIKTYNIIYELLDELDEVIEALRKGDLVEVFGTAKVLAVFNIKGETVLGAKVTSGRIAKGDQIKVTRNDEEIGRIKIKSLKQQKTDITKAETGTEIGIGLSGNMAVLTGDSIISIG